MSKIKPSPKKWIKKGAILALAVLYITMATGCSTYKVSVAGLTINDPVKEHVQYADSGQIKTDASPASSAPLVTSAGGKVVLGVILVAVGVGVILLMAKSFEDSFDKDADEWGPCLWIYC